MSAPVKVSQLCVEVLELWSQGLSTKKIADLLNTNERTIASRLIRASRLLGARDSGHAAALAMAAGLIAGPEPVACVMVPSRARSLDDFVEDFKVLHGRGLTRKQVAEKMRIKPCTYDARLSRARKAGLLPAVRERVASC